MGVKSNDCNDSGTHRVGGGTRRRRRGLDGCASVGVGDVPDGDEGSETEGDVRLRFPDRPEGEEASKFG